MGVPAFDDVEVFFQDFAVDGVIGLTGGPVTVPVIFDNNYDAVHGQLFHGMNEAPLTVADIPGIDQGMPGIQVQTSLVPGVKIGDTVQVADENFDGYVYNVIDEYRGVTTLILTVDAP